MELQSDRRYTYADYVTWDDDQRYELIDGVPYLMSSPSSAHQEISGNLFLQFATFLKGKTCKVFSAPYDVRLNAEDKDDTVVQPDISIICDPNKIEEKGCKGAPDMIVEILSPSTARHDQLVKFNKYREAGVQEYWIVNPEGRNVQAFLLKDGGYFSQAYGDVDSVPINVLDDCQINLADVFPPAAAQQ